ncbi:MAG TPA: hypothetical protein VFS08_00920 [Gemmatimonadaceae bacterium]|nr:hypothetical protein [Gemmatimonadaceae bacterium]
MPMRAQVLLWSALGGAVVGLIAAALLVGLGALVHLLLPEAAARALARAAPVVVPLVVVVCVVAGAVLGYLEGRLKL